MHANGTTTTTSSSCIKWWINLNQHDGGGYDGGATTYLPGATTMDGGVEGVTHFSSSL